MTTETGHIYSALADVMADVDHVAKRDRNSQQNYNFRGIDAVVNAVGPALRKHGVIVVPDVEHVEYEQLSTRNGGSVTSARVVVGYTFIASADGSTIRTRVAAEAFDYGDKATPKAMSVAFRTALLQALALPTDDPDPDQQTYERGPAQQQAAPAAQQDGQRTMSRPRAGSPDDPASDAQLGMIAGLCGQLGVTDREARLIFVGTKLATPRHLTSGRDLTKREASAVIDVLNEDLKALDTTQQAGDQE